MAPQTENNGDSTIEVILDTNILQYYLTKEIKPSLDSFFKELTTAKISFAISQVTIEEILCGATIAQEKKALEQIQVLKQYSVDDAVLIGAARLKSLYTIEKVPDNQINLGDRIIASTSIITGSPVLTANVNDFPRPYFAEAYRYFLTYTKKSNSKGMSLQILKPDTELILERFSHRQ